VTVVDGQSFRVGENTYQLAGIFAPKLAEECIHRGHVSHCGHIAADRLREFFDLENRPIECFFEEKGHERIAACLVNNQEISEILLAGGYVAALPDSAPHYAIAEHKAREARLGLWGGRYTPPWQRSGGKGAYESFLARATSFDHRDIHVIDGDTFQVGANVYQLAGIDAPELGQACEHHGKLWLCGLDAANRLRKLFSLETLPIRCLTRPTEDISVATCVFGDSEVSIALLAGGWVTALPNSTAHYRAAEHRAKRASLGIWGSQFIRPWEWRQGKRLPREHSFNASSNLKGDLPWKWKEGGLRYQSQAEHVSCLVKGVVTDSGERLYFGPLDEGFDAIPIDPARGEQMFCGDDNARQAGWKRKAER
jgi:endonuclease YncB( thermonuclease family)